MFPKPERKILRRMGYLKDQQGILNRYFREQENWESHIQNTREFILNSLKDKHPSLIRVLGSGWLLDFPLEKVYDICGNIELLDVHHPPQLMRKVRDFKGISCVVADITGGMIENVYHFVREKKESDFPKIPFASLPSPDDDVYYISLNVLNQLDILLVDFLRKSFRPGEDEFISFRKQIQQAHINMISRNHFCLISDFSEILINREGHEFPGKQLVFADIPPCSMQKNWKWFFDISFGYYSQYKTVFEVNAFSC